MIQQIRWFNYIRELHKIQEQEQLIIPKEVRNEKVS